MYQCSHKLGKSCERPFDFPWCTLRFKVLECSTCKRPTLQDECDNCWEVERRLEEYLRTPGGREKMTIALQRVESTAATAYSQSEDL